ncbi:MAG: CoA transferase [Chloroflexi bacterium]|nr:CoA transferase [Chloroflexota bacterium]
MTSPPNALAGIRIIDFSNGIVGYCASGLLSYLGAELIRVESRKRIAIHRTVVHPVTKKPVDPDESPAFFDMEQNRLGVTLNLKHPGAVEIAKQLVRISDVVVENFRPGVMQRLGLDYATLSQERPDLVMLSSSTRGQTGPEAQVAGYAPLFAAAAGLGELTGYPDSPPSQLRLTTDYLGAVTNALAIIVALHHRLVSGRGQHLDVSSTEALSVLIGDSLLDYTATGRVQRRAANRDVRMAPHNCYRCQGEDRWISIAVGTDKEWSALRRVMGDPDWPRDPRFDTMAGRWQHQDELDRHIEAWTCAFDCYDLMRRLQAAGVAAMPSFSNKDLFTDPHLNERNLALEIDQPKAGRVVVQNPPWKLSATPPRIERHAPPLGQDNEFVFREVLGISGANLKRLGQEGALT